MSIQKVSVALCTYNGEKFIEKQLLSILNQTVLPFEIVIFDDKSTDSTLNIVNRIANDFNIKWIIKQNEKQLGVVRNFEQAIMSTTGDYVALADQDDIWLPHKIEQLLVCLSNGYSLVYSDTRIVDKDGKDLFMTFSECNKIHESMSLLQYLQGCNNVIGCTVLFDAKLKSYIFPFPIKFVFHDLWIAAIAYNHGGICYYPKPLVLYRQHDKNVVGAMNENRKPIDIKHFKDKAYFTAFVLRRRKDIEYPYYIHMYMWYRYIIEKSGIAWLKYRITRFLS